MNILGKKGLGNKLKVLLIIGFVLATLVVIYLPFLLSHSDNIFYSMIIIYPNGILLLGIIYQFIKLFKSLEDNNPFNYENVKTLKVTSCISLIMSLLWLIDLLVMVFLMHNSHLSYIIVLLFLMILFFGVAVALYILSELFKQATEYKEENDLTI